MSAANLFDLDAEVGSEEDEDFDDEAGEGSNERKSKAGVEGFDDSSEEDEDDDDDPEAQRAVREGFIVDEDEDETAEERRERKRKRREQRERDEVVLDEDDLDLIGALPDRAAASEPKLKRLKRGHRDSESTHEPRRLDNIFDDDEEEEIRRRDREPVDELEDFIEEDEFSDDDPDAREEAEISRKRTQRGMAALNNLQGAGLDEAGMEDMYAAFGDGEDYNWALDMEENAEQEETHDYDKPIELKDVFEPSQLEERLLTDEDHIIRSTDIPERYQISRKPFPVEDLTPEEMEARIEEEASWVGNMLWPKKRFESHLRQPFENCIANVLRFANVEHYEVPFIFQHRKDYLIHTERQTRPENMDGEEEREYEVHGVKLLEPSDLWDVLDLDLQFRAITQKRHATKRTFEAIQEASGVQDNVVDELLSYGITMDDVQDVQDYVYFQYSAEIKDNSLRADGEITQKRSRGATGLYERMRASQSYNVVRKFGIAPDELAQSLQQENRRVFVEDPTQMPEDLADQFTDTDFDTGTKVLKAAKTMYAEELFMCPRLRRWMRLQYYMNGNFNCFRTDKGLTRIDEDHPYHEFKYLRNQSLTAIARRPEMFLRMLKAEDEGLIQIKLNLENRDQFRRQLQRHFQSDNYSEIADAWNGVRRDIMDMALLKLERIMVKSVKENLKTECENQLARACREAYSTRLDQAPYRSKGLAAGTPPRALCLTNGTGTGGRDSIYWAYIGDDGRLSDHGRFSELRVGNEEKSLPDTPDVKTLLDLIERREPDVVGVSGLSVEARTLYKDVQAIMERHDVRTPKYEDEDEVMRSDRLEVVIVQDEVARLYHTSDRSKVEHPGLTPLTKYCVALGRYLQNPMLEYALLGRDVLSISFDPNQHLLPQEKLKKHLETAMVDIVNLVGVEINEAVADDSIATLLQYVCGLGPRKAAGMLQAINKDGGYVTTRFDLVSPEDTGKVAACGPKIFDNCASFLIIEYDRSENGANYLDSTRVHPEDYELAKKMAADAMELDEEDIQAEETEYGTYALIRKLIRDEQQEQVNHLVLEGYAEQLEKDFKSRKRATLETIRAEIQTPYEELRRTFITLSTDEIFTMFTGETRESLCENMILPVSLRRIFPDHIEARLDCGIEGVILESDFPAGVGMNGASPRDFFQPRQTVQAKVTFLNRKGLSAQLSLREDALRRPYRREIDHDPGEWDDAEEEADRRTAQKQKEQTSGRVQRVIKHPLFKSFNAKQAEEFLGPQARGDVVIRPSSKGLDHLAVTWKVADNVFQHIDVLELDKENEFSVGRILKIGGRYTYSDLDELIVNHVKSMAKKVDEIMTDERYQTGSKTQTEQWLSAYMEANPTRAMYAFCLNRQYPGYFYICFKSGANADPMNWSIKIIPNAFELKGNGYPDMKALKNGFKTLIGNERVKRQQGGSGMGGHPGAPGMRAGMVPGGMTPVAGGYGGMGGMTPARNIAPVAGRRY